MDGRGTRERSLAVRIDERIDALARFVAALGRFLADIALFAGTMIVVWGGLTWLGFQVDRILGTDPRGEHIVGQAGPFSMLGVVSGLVASLFAINWITTRPHRKR